jgi:endonuclease/exonuclease/phosphatase family metal-dependent hydrolase
MIGFFSMINVIKKICIIIISALLFTTEILAQPIRIMTFNIRLDIPEDGVNAWKNRKENLVSMIRFHKADIIGLQEAQRHQIEFIQKSLPEFSWFGVGRDDGKEKGEFTAIFYRRNRFDTLGTSTFWLSENPDHSGLGWDAAYQRIATFGKFKDHYSGKIFYLFNTHLDNEGKIARLESAKLIKNKIRKICGNIPVILTGDFNSSPDSEAYQQIISGLRSDSSQQLFDTQSISQTPHHGPVGTFTGFDIFAKPKFPIDFIFVSEGISVLSHGTLSDSFDGYLPSDHYPVLTEIIF